MRITQFGEKYSVNITEAQTFWPRFMDLCEQLKSGENPTFGFFFYDEFDVFKLVPSQDFHKRVNNSKNVDDFHLFMMYLREDKHEVEQEESEVYKGAIHLNVEPNVVRGILYEILNTLEINTDKENLLPLFIVFDIVDGRVMKQKHVLYDSSVEDSIIENDLVSIFNNKSLINWNNVIELGVESMKFLNRITKVIGAACGEA